MHERSVLNEGQAIEKCIHKLIYVRSSILVNATSSQSHTLRRHQQTLTILSITFLYHIQIRYLPNVIIGDLDSVRPEVRAFYTSRGVEVVDLGEDQMSTDLAKARPNMEGKACLVLSAAIPMRILPLLRSSACIQACIHTIFITKPSRLAVSEADRGAHVHR